MGRCERGDCAAWVWGTVVDAVLTELDNWIKSSELEKELYYYYYYLLLLLEAATPSGV